MVLNRRDTENSATQAKLLVYAKDQRTLRESELQHLLDAEREKVALSLAKQSTLVRDLSSAESKLAEIASEKGRNAPREVDLERLLRAEREKVIISNAKYNTLKNKADREISTLQEKLQIAEDAAMFERLEERSSSSNPDAGALSISTTPTYNTGSNTFPPSPESRCGCVTHCFCLSHCFSPPHSHLRSEQFGLVSLILSDFRHVASIFSAPRHAPPPPLHLRQSLQRQYISSEASEQDLFSRVQRKLAGRKTSEVTNCFLLLCTGHYVVVGVFPGDRGGGNVTAGGGDHSTHE